MKFRLYFLAAFLLGACGGENSGSAPQFESQDRFISDESINVEDLTGFWSNSCIESNVYSNVYQREFLDYNSGTISKSSKHISIGVRNYSDSDCIQSVKSRLNGDGQLEIIPDYEGVETAFSVMGVYRTTEGLEAKVIEFANEVNGSTRIAYHINEGELYFAYEKSGSYEFDFSNPYVVINE